MLSQFRTRLIAHDLQSMAVEMLTDRLVGPGLLKPGGRQRTDATHVVAAVSDHKASGTGARHGRLSQQPPKVPMTLPQAREMIGKLVTGWLDKYQES